MEKKTSVSLVTDVFPLSRGGGDWPLMYGPFYPEPECYGIDN